MPEQGGLIWFAACTWMAGERDMSGSRTGIRGIGQLVLALFALSLGWAHPADAQAIKVGSFTKSTTTPGPVTQIVPHGLAQTPKALILWTDGRPNETFGNSFRYAFGMTDAPMSSLSTAMYSRNNRAQFRSLAVAWRAKR